MYIVEDFGARGQGGIDCTVALQSAIDRCNQDGGGTVVLTQGTYVAGTVRLKSNVELRVNAGATLKAIDDQECYPDIPNTFTDGTSNTLHPERKGYALLYAFEATNVSITGGGTIDVGGERFQEKSKRPFLVRIMQSERVTISDVTLMQSAAWCCHLQKSNHIRMSNVTVRASGVRNGDGIDIDSSTDVVITGCDIKTGDDAICCKSTFEAPCADIQVNDCVMESNCSGFKIGTESVGDFRNISVSGCELRNCGVVALKVTAVDGGSVENVRFHDLQIKDSTGPVFIANGSRGRRYMDAADSGRRSAISNISFSNIRITSKRYVRQTRGRDVTDFGQGIVISGNPDSPIRNVRFEDVDTAFWGGVDEYERTPEDVPFFTDHYPECHQLGLLPSYGYFLQYAEDITFENCTDSVINQDCRPLMWERMPHE